MSQSLLKAEHIKISFGNVHALRDVSLEILPGEIHCLAGENGCGKSTIIKIISGVYQRDGGTIEFNGQKIDKISPIDAINLGIQVIYQDFALFPNLTVAENLALNTELASRKKTVSWKNVRKIAEEAVSKINFRVDLDEKVEKLTVAQKQMVAISRALMSNAKLIIMDEPTTALTKKEVSALFKIILKLKEQGIAILFISHKLDEVFEISDRFTIFRDGELVATGSTKELDDKKFTYYMTGREFSDNIFVPKNVSDKPVFELKHLTLNGSFSDINLSLRRGEILGITGLLDSGRTELGLSMFGLKPADSGQIIKDGQEIKLTSPREAIANSIGYVPEDRLSEGLFLTQSIGDNIIISEIDKLKKKYRFDPNKPTIAFMMSNLNGNFRAQLAKKIKEKYGEKYQTVSLYSYNKYADIPYIADLTPQEWSIIFGLFQLTISKYFHGTMFSLLNRTPVIAVSAEKSIDGMPNKISDALERMKLSDFYFSTVNSESVDWTMLMNKIDECLSMKMSSTIKNRISCGLDKERRCAESFFVTLGEVIADRRKSVD